jgi:predicted acyltransferase
MNKMIKTPRYLALDVLRGITVVAMITVNNPGSWAHIYAPLRHSEWSGCTPTDLVFPFFLFLVGVSMFFSFKKYGNTLNTDSLWRLCRRTLLIFAIGLFLNSFPQWMTDYSKLRILGVLQRIALAYGLGSLLVLTIPRKYLPWAGAGILFLYWGILFFFGGTDPYSLQENATLAFDKAILGESHMYKGFGMPFDPEGLLSTIPAIVTVIIGYLIGQLIDGTEKKKVPVRLLLCGLSAVVIGWAWGQFFPINKPLWTSSYVIYSSGWACLMFSLLIWVIDVKGYTRWTSFFVVFGMNALFIFALSGLWAKTISRLMKFTEPDGTVISGYSWLYHHMYLPWAGELNGSLFFALSHIIVFWLICYVLYVKKIFIKV